MHTVDTIVSGERGKVQEKSHVKQALTMNGCPEWLINSIPTIEPYLERTTVSSDDTNDETEMKTSHKKPPVRNPL